MNKRLKKFDLLKGILIILVILGHAMNYSFNDVWNNKLFNCIYSFHMPLFIFLSGYFFKSCLKKNIKEMLINKYQRLMMPTIIFTTIIILIVGAPYKNIFCLWYTCCIFFLTIFLYIYIKSSSWIKISMLISYIACLLYYNQLPLKISTILNSIQIIRMLPIFILGFLYRVSLENNKLNNNRINIIFISTFIISLYIKIVYGFNLLKYNVFLRIIDGICCSAIIYIIFDKIATRICKFPISSVIILLGQKSLVVYLIHIMIYKIILFYFPINSIPFSNSLSIISIFVIINISIPLIFDYLITNKLIRKYIFGE